MGETHQKLELSPQMSALFQLPMDLVSSKEEKHK